MKLIPKAKPVRIRISAGGQEHSSLDTLLENFDIESLLPLYINGSLSRWLNQIGAFDIADKLSKLQISDFDNITDDELESFVKAFFNNEISTVAQKIAHSYESSENGEQIVRWHQIAYKYGNIESCSELGLIYKYGLFGVRQCHSKAIEYYKIAAEDGDADAQCDLAWYYEKGLCIEQSTVEAISLLEKAAKSGLVRSYFNLACVLYSQERYEEARKWCELAINNEEELDIDKLEFIADLYDTIGGYEKQCYEYYLQAAIQGSPRSQIIIGLHYENGIYVKEDENQAFYWYKRAADADDADGQFHVSRCYFFGYGVIQDIDSSMRWAKMAVKQNSTPAKLILAFCYGNQGSYNTAFELLTEAAEAGYGDAQYCLGDCYESGKWGRKNIKTAISWYKKAAENGDSDAIEKLKELGVE